MIACDQTRPSAKAMTDTSAQRKARGAFFTPPEITRFLAEWAVRSPDDSVLEPSCGEAEFLLAAARRLRELGAGLLAGQHLHGIELHLPSAKVAEERLSEAGFLADVTTADFFDTPATRSVDAVIGNPPYVRYQEFAGDARAKALRAALRAGVRLNGLASSWAAFVVHSASFLHQRGRLGLVLPAELLSVKYAAPVRRFLLRRFESVKLVMFERLVFPHVQEEVVLLLAEGTGSADHFRVYQARDAAELPDIAESAWSSYTPGDDGKWLPAVLPPEVVESYHAVTEGDGFESLVDWGETYLGCVTGNNQYFTFDKETAFDLRIPPEELLRISPPGSRHLKDLSFGDKDWESMRDGGRRCYLLRPNKVKPTREARQYILAGEKVGIHKAYKCRVRTPWWRVPMVRVPDLLLTYMDRDRPRLVSNRAGVYHLNSLYGVKLQAMRRSLGMDLLPLASINSVTLLGAELVGRAYGGGLLKVEPREADRLPVPSVSLLEPNAERLLAIGPHVSVRLRRGDLRGAVDLVDEILLKDMLRLSGSEVDRFRAARRMLFGRRAARAKARGKG